MISKQAQDGFNHLLIKAIKSSLVMPTADACEVNVLTDLTEIEETKMVILTVSSYLFRLMVFIYFTPDDSTKEYFARINKTQALDMSEQSFYDAIAECGNICCGILNRDLSQFFPHIGMSTPNIIDKNCSSYLNVLGCGHIQHFKVNVNDINGASFHVSLCINDFADLHFILDKNEEETNTGELELF
jgi:hypothetical protein